MGYSHDFSFNYTVERFNNDDRAQYELDRLEVFSKRVLDMDRDELLYVVWAFHNYINELQEDKYKNRNRYYDLLSRMEQIMNITIEE